jgi:hypothetical protein
MPDNPSGLPFNAQPQPSELRRFLDKYENLPRLGTPLPNDDPEMVEDYKKVSLKVFKIQIRFVFFNIICKFAIFNSINSYL